MAAHSSILAWKIPWVEEPGGLQSMGLQKVGHDWACTHITGNNVVMVSGAQQWLSHTYACIQCLLTVPSPDPTHKHQTLFRHSNRSQCRGSDGKDKNGYHIPHPKGTQTRRRKGRGAFHLAGSYNLVLATVAGRIGVTSCLGGGLSRTASGGGDIQGGLQRMHRNSQRW